MSQKYNLSTIRDLLLSSFNAEELQELFYFSENPDLRKVVHQFVPGDSLPARVHKAVRYCESRLLLAELLAEVEQRNPRQYKRFEPRLPVGVSLPSSRDTLAEAADQEVQERAARLEAERLEREKQRRQAAERRHAQLEDLYRQATARLEKRDWAGARELLAQVEEIEPGYREALALLRQAKVEQGRAEQVDRLVAQGMGYLEEGKWRLANQAFRQILDLAPDHAEAPARIAEAERQQQIASRLVSGQNDLKAGRWSESASHFQAVLDIEPAHQDANNLLAEAQAHDRARKEAAERAQVPAGGRATTAWLILGVVLLFSLAAPLNQSKLLAISLIEEHSPGRVQNAASLPMLAYSISVLFFALPAGLIYQKAGVRVTGLLAGGLILLGATLGAVSQNMAMLVAGCFVAGAGVSFMAVLAPAIIGQWFSARRRGTALGIWVACTSIGMAMLLAAAFAASTAVAGSLNIYMPGFLTEHDLVPAQVALLMGITALLSSFSALAGGALSDRIGSRKKPYLVGLAAPVVLLPLVGVLGVNWLIVLVVAITVLLTGAVRPTILAAAVESTGDERQAGAAVAVIMVGQHAGLLLGGLVFSELARSSWPAAFASLAVMSALGLLAGWLAKVR